MGVRNCSHKGLEELFIKGKSKRIGQKYHKNIMRILDHLAAVTDIKDCVGVKDFHPLKGDRKGTYSMHVSGNYCVIFRWDGDDVYDIDFVDYH